MPSGIICFFIMFLSCGGDDEPIDDVQDAPIVSIKITRENPVNEFVKEIGFQIVTDTAPETDLLVIISVRIRRAKSGENAALTGRHRVLIPKGKKNSQEFSTEIDIHGQGIVSIEELPMVSIVGEGVVIDQEDLQGWWELSGTLGGHKVPDDFQFPYYEVGEPAEVILYRPKDAKILSIDPPNGSLIQTSYWGRDKIIIINFDTPPLQPRIESRIDPLHCVNCSYGGTVYFNTISSTQFVVDVPGIIWNSEYILDIRWGLPEADTITSQSFSYTLIRQD